STGQNRQAHKAAGIAEPPGTELPGTAALHCRASRRHVWLKEACSARYARVARTVTCGALLLGSDRTSGPDAIEGTRGGDHSSGNVGMELTIQTTGRLEACDLVAALGKLEGRRNVESRSRQIAAEKIDAGCDGFKQRCPLAEHLTIEREDAKVFRQRHPGYLQAEI